MTVNERNVLLSAKKGYYTLIQFCPDPSRAEAVNLGLILFCPELEFICARTSSGNRRAAKLVGRESVDRLSLNAAKRAIERRLETDKASFRELEDFEQFVNTRGNILKLTVPRPVKVFDPATEITQLFDELVGGRARSRTDRPAAPQLDDLFQRLHTEGRARLNWDITVPVLNRRLRVPYAYRNGVWNLVVPHCFPKQERPALSAAARLAIEGDLLHKHQSDTEDAGERRLIVVSTFESDGVSPDVKGRIAQLLREYDVESVIDTEIDAFATRVQREAHG